MLPSATVSLINMWRRRQGEVGKRSYSRANLPCIDRRIDHLLQIDTKHITTASLEIYEVKKTTTKNASEPKLFASIRHIVSYN